MDLIYKKKNNFKVILDQTNQKFIIQSVGSYQINNFVCLYCIANIITWTYKANNNENYKKLELTNAWSTFVAVFASSFYNNFKNVWQKKN